MRALLLALFACSSLAHAGAPEGYVTETRELDFKAASQTQFSADSSRIDYAGGRVTTGSAKLIGGLEVLPGARVHLRTAGLFSGREATFPALVERDSTGTVLEIIVPAQAFRFWNKPDHIFDELHCIAKAEGGLECHQATYVRSNTFGF